MKHPERLCPDEIMALQSQEIERVKCHAWQPIATAPNDGTEGLIYSLEFGVDIGYCKMGGDWGLSSGYSNFAINPTHWMSLPKLPKGE
jgi:hypothetical protein